MRELMIQFGDEGEYFREIDHERHYFLSEAEEIILKIRNRLVKEKRMVKPKPFEFWINGKRLIVTEVSFESKESIEVQLVDTILKFEQWQEETRHKYINLLKENAEEERQLFLSREFSEFAVRFDQLLGGPKVKPYPLILGIKQLKVLFDGIFAHVTTGFYSVLEEVIMSLGESYQTNVTSIEKALFKEGGMEALASLEEVVKGKFGEDEYYKSYVTYATVSYQSVSKNRIDSLYSRFIPYQILQKLLFETVAAEIGFDEALALHKGMSEDLYQEFDDILFSGFVLKDDGMVESLVLSPVVTEYERKAWLLLREEDLEGAERVIGEVIESEPEEE